MKTTGGAYPQAILSNQEDKLCWAVEDAILSDASKVTQEVTGMKGFGTVKVLNFLNNLCANVKQCRYLEFGTWCGRSLVAASFQNDGIFVGLDNFQGIEDFTYYNLTNNDVRLLLHKNISGRKNITFHEMDCLDFTSFLPFNVFFYDGDHNVTPTAAALTHASHGNLLSFPEAVLIVDDYESKIWDVKEGLRQGLRLGEYRVCKFWELPRSNGYHEGLWVGVVNPRG